MILQNKSAVSWHRSRKEAMKCSKQLDVDYIRALCPWHATHGGRGYRHRPPDDAADRFALRSVTSSSFLNFGRNQAKSLLPKRRARDVS